MAARADNAGNVADTSPAHTTPYAWYVASMLSLGFLLSIGDRYLMGVVLEDVKHDLGLSDTQLGILGGPSFVLLFLFASIPFGRLADTANRKFIVVAGLAGWSLATAACGLANSFGQLMAARLCIGLGEATLMPCAMSLISAYFSRDKLARGLSVYSAGSSFGRFAAFAGGGAMLAWFTVQGGLTLQGLGYFKPWQGVFLICGVLGLLVALLFLLTVKEPPRRGPPPKRGDLKAGFAFFWKHRRAYLALFVPFGMVNGLGVVLAAWSVSFLLRTHHMPVAVASGAMGLIGLIFGPIGHLGGGVLNDFIRNRGQAAQPLVMAVILAISAAGVALFTIAPSLPVAMTIYCLGYIAICGSAPTAYSGTQLPTPERFRGVMSSLMLIIYSGLGAGLGPLLVGLFGDYYFHSDKHLGPSIMLTALVMAAIGIPTALFGARKFSDAVKANEG